MNSLEYELIGSIIHSFEEHYIEDIVVIDRFEPFVQVNRNPLENIQILEVRIADLDKKLNIYQNQFNKYQIDSNFDLKETFGLFLKENLKSNLFEIAESFEKEKQSLEDIGEYPDLRIDIFNEYFPPSIHDFFLFLITCEVLEKLKGYVDVWNKLLTKSDNWEKIKKGLLEKEWLKSYMTKYLYSHRINEAAFIDIIYLYSESWINRLVTLLEWEALDGLDFWKLINLLDVNVNAKTLILVHQRTLLREYVLREVNLLNRVYLAGTPELLDRAKFNYMVLEQFFYKGDRTVSTIENLNGIRSFKIEDFELILVEFQNLLRDGKYKINEHIAGYSFEHRYTRPSLVASIFKMHYDFLRGYEAAQEGKDLGISKVSKNKKKIVIPNSFNYLNYKKATDILTKVCMSLIEKGFIDDSTTPSMIIKIFSGKVVTKKIKWISDVKFLHYFIKELTSTYSDKIVPIKYRKHWEIAVKCFQTEEGAEYLSSQLESNNLKPKDKNRLELKFIDEILALL